MASEAVAGFICIRTMYRARASTALRYVVKTRALLRWMPNDLPFWELVYQQIQRWLATGCFGLVHEQ